MIIGWEAAFGIGALILGLALAYGLVRYYTRNKRDIHTIRDESGGITRLGGVKPDVVVTETDKDIEAQGIALRDRPFDRRAAAQFSPQIKKGLELIKARLAGKPWPKSEKDQPDKPGATETASNEGQSRPAPAIASHSDDE